MATSSICVITGATHGLGLECAKALSSACSFTDIVLACRDVPAARAVASAFPRLVVLDAPLDLADMASVRAYARALTSWLGARRISTCVLNAGVGGSAPLRLSPQGFERIWATNHLGHFLFSILMLPIIDQRIIFVSSEVHDAATGTPLPDPSQHFPTTRDTFDAHLAHGEPVGGEGARVNGNRHYSRSKLCNILCGDELARLLTGAAPRGADAAAVSAAAALPHGASCSLPAARTIAVSAMNPGLMLDSNFVTGIAGSAIGGIAWLLSPVLRLTPLGTIMRTAPTSGAALARLAEGAASETGAYYDGDVLKPASAFARSAQGVAAQHALWAHSLRWAGVTDDECRAAGLPLPMRARE